MRRLEVQGIGGGGGLGGQADGKKTTEKGKSEEIQGTHGDISIGNVEEQFFL